MSHEDWLCVYMYNIIIRNIVKIFIFVDSIIIIVVRLWGFATLGLPVRVLVFCCTCTQYKPLINQRSPL